MLLKLVNLLKEYLIIINMKAYIYLYIRTYKYCSDIQTKVHICTYTLSAITSYSAIKSKYARHTNI